MGVFCIRYWTWPPGLPHITHYTQDARIYTDTQVKGKNGHSIWVHINCALAPGMYLSFNSKHLWASHTTTPHRNSKEISPYTWHLTFHMSPCKIVLNTLQFFRLLMYTGSRWRNALLFMVDKLASAGLKRTSLSLTKVGASLCLAFHAHSHPKKDAST